MFRLTVHLVLVAGIALGMIGVLAGPDAVAQQKTPTCAAGWILCQNAAGAGCCRPGSTCHPNKPICCHAGSVPDPKGWCKKIGAGGSKAKPKKAVGKKPKDKKAGTSKPSGKKKPADKKAAGKKDKKQKKDAKVECDVCDRHLYGDLSRALGVSGNAVVNVRQAINDFYRCRQRAGGQCGATSGLSLVEFGLKNGCLGVAAIRSNEASFISCVSKNL